MGAVAADFIDGHEDTDDDGERAENKESEGERYLLNRRSVVDDVGRFHQIVIVRNRKGVIHIRHCKSQQILSRSVFDVEQEIW